MSGMANKLWVTLKLDYKDFVKRMNKASSSLKRFQLSLKKVHTPMNNLSKKFKSLTKGFQGWALSIMFFGMAIQRVFMGIIRKSFGVFNEVMSTTEGAISNISLLSANFEYLGFVIGSALNSALAPFMDTIINVVATIAEWVEQNPKLTAGLLLAGAAIGYFLMVTGMVVLGIIGLVQAWGVLSGIWVAGVKVIAAIGAALGIHVGVVLLLIVAIVMLLYAAWKSNFGNIQEFTKAIFQNIWTTVSSVFGSIFKALSSLMKSMTALMEGRTDEFFGYLLQALSFLGEALVKAGVGIIALVVNILGAMLSMFKDFAVMLIKIGIFVGKEIARFFLKPFQEAIDGLNDALDFLGKKRININLLDISDKVYDWGDSIFDKVALDDLPPLFPPEMLAKVYKGIEDGNAWKDYGAVAPTDSSYDESEYTPDFGAAPVQAPISIGGDLNITSNAENYQQLLDDIYKYTS